MGESFITMTPLGRIVLLKMVDTCLRLASYWDTGWLSNRRLVERLVSDSVMVSVPLSMEAAQMLHILRNLSA